VEVLVTDDLKEFGVLASQLKLEHQVCHFHVLRWVCRALAELRKQLPDEHHLLIDEVWQIMKERSAQGRVRLFDLWQGLPARRKRDQRTSALYRLRLLILRLHEKWQQYTLDQRQPDVPATNNATERSIGRWRIRSHATRGFKSWAGSEAALLLCSDPIA
jgi:hypothetical protein